MTREPFGPEEIAALREAIEISEDVAGNHFKISTSEWKRYRYDIQSLKDLREDEIIETAFAQLRRYAFPPGERRRGTDRGDFFKICLQDHVIRGALARNPELAIVPFCAYIVVHELIHVVRFARFLQSFHTTDAEREAEEHRVHLLTHQLLENRKLPGMARVLKEFSSFLDMETFVDRAPEHG